MKISIRCCFTKPANDLPSRHNRIFVLSIVLLNEFKNRLAEYLDLAKRENVIVTKKGRVAALLRGVTDENLEYYLFETDPRFMARIKSLRRQYREEGGTLLDDVRKELGSTFLLPVLLPVRSQF